MLSNSLPKAALRKI
ncbi:hypothetical protein YPPY10_2726, partial [Yersinia pestis PY-10]